LHILYYLSYNGYTALLPLQFEWTACFVSNIVAAVRTKGFNTMQRTTPPAISVAPVRLRLLVAFLLGLPIGPLPFLLPWLLWVMPVMWLAAVLLISIQRDPVVRQGMTDERARRASLLMLLILGMIVATMAILFGVGSGIAGLALIPLGVSLIVTFAVGSGGRLLMALGCGLAAWLGVCIHLLVGIAIIAASREGTFGIIMMLTGIEMIVGMVIAIPGALLGKFLRRWLLGGNFTNIE
jgi:hypothetical protein